MLLVRIFLVILGESRFHCFYEDFSNVRYPSSNFFFSFTLRFLAFYFSAFAPEFLLFFPFLVPSYCVLACLIFCDLSSLTVSCFQSKFM